MEYKRYVQRNKHYQAFLNHDEEEIFSIVFDVSSLKEDELIIELVEGNKLKISFKHGLRSTGNLNFSRDCTYVYVLPGHVKFTNLVAHWSEDNFLVIKESKSRAIARATLSEDDEEEIEEWVLAIKDSIFSTLDSGMENIDNLLNGMSNAFKELTSEQSSLNPETKSIKTGSESKKEKLAQEKLPKSSSSEIGEMTLLGDKSRYEYKKNLMQVSKSTNVSNESEITLKEGSSSASSESEKIIKLETKSPNESKTSIQKLIQKDESMDESNTVLTKSLLIPKRTNHFFDLINTMDGLQDAMNDIGGKIQFLNEIIDKHSDLIISQSKQLKV